MTPQIGTAYLDSKPAIDLPDWRRIVHVTEVDDRYVHAVGRWQQYIAGRWFDDSAPGNRRKTRILLSAFERQYAPVKVDA